MKEKLVGKTHAEDIVTNKDDRSTVGKVTRVDDAPAPLQHLLSPAERDAMTINLKIRIVAAGARCNDAIQAVKIHTLLKKPDDMPWVFGMLLDVCISSLTTAAVRSLTKFKAGKISAHGNAAADAASVQDSAAFDAAERRKAAFQFVSDDAIKMHVGTVGGLAKTSAKSIVAMTLADTQEKAQTLSYLHQLQKSMDLAFQNLGESDTQGLSDAELMVFFDAMDTSNHGSELYERAITDKIDRYMKSGVEQLGKHQDVNGIADPQRHYETIGTVESEKRVVWVEYPDKTKALFFYEKAESTSNARSHELAMAQGMDGKFHLKSIVSREFWDEAVARCEETTGKPVETIPDSPATRAMLGMPTHAPAKAGTIRSATNKIFGGK